jgi:hypothetical protein
MSSSGRKAAKLSTSIKRFLIAVVKRFGAGREQRSMKI